MIIKVIPIRSKSKAAIDKVVEYIASDKGRADYLRQGIFHNLLSTDLDRISEEIHENFKNYSRKRNLTQARHCILSYSPVDRDKITIEMMDEMAREYLKEAFRNKALAFGTHHLDETHLHTHIIVGGNELMSKTSTRQTKADLYQVHAHMLKFVQQRYPELTVGIDIENYGKKLGRSEEEYYQQKRNPHAELTKDQLSEKVLGLFRLSENSTDFKSRLETLGLKTYNYQGRLQGIQWGGEGKKMRFSRLGLKYEKIEELDVQNERLRELEELRGEQELEQGLDLD